MVITKFKEDKSKQRETKRKKILYHSVSINSTDLKNITDKTS